MNKWLFVSMSWGVIMNPLLDVRCNDYYFIIFGKMYNRFPPLHLESYYWQHWRYWRDRGGWWWGGPSCPPPPAGGWWRRSRRPPQIAPWAGSRQSSTWSSVEISQHWIQSATDSRAHHYRKDTVFTKDCKKISSFLKSQFSYPWTMSW